MNKYRSVPLISAAFALAVFSITGCKEKVISVEVPSRPSAPTVVTSAQPTSAEPTITMQAKTTVSTEAVSVQWTDLKDYTYDQRGLVFAGLKKLEAKADQQVSELMAKRAAMNSTANTNDWDFAMKEMGESRSYLKSTIVELTQATPEFWSQIKDKVGQAWVRTQDAYAKVKSSTTL